ncbi:MAG: HAD-IIIC family phosphatase [Burkholderiales bacterium]
MYEAEVNEQIGSLGEIPEQILAGIAEYRDRVEARSLLPWGEHCTECAWPSCYTTCDLYEPRIDGGCRQFVGGVVRISNPRGTVPYFQKIRFRRWAKLWARGSTRCVPVQTADRWERVNIAVGSVAQAIPAPTSIKQRLLLKVSHARREHFVNGAHSAAENPDYFVVEIYNPNDRPVDLTLSIRNQSDARPKIFQRRLTAKPGLTRDRTPFDEIAALVDASGALEVELTPNESEDLTLYFGLMDFVRERSVSGTSSQSELDQGKSCKCVVWDLDNTLWNGVLIEDGLANIKLREDLVSTIKKLDERGILQSIASKNNRADAIEALRAFGLEDYFLHPQINWSPKSQSVAAIAEALNIDLDTFFFVDDQPFEREEVRAALPKVRVLDVEQVGAMLESPSFQVPVTDESRTRRIMYREQVVRDALEASYEGDYLRFLKEIGMQVQLAHLGEANVERVYELAQRTNQMNFSGNRYSMEQLRDIANDKGLDTYVLRCTDRFGTYGIVGFALVDNAEPRLLDLMFSCRVQAKRVEHAFLSWLLKRHRARGDSDFLANYRKTPKNAPSGIVFHDLGFDEVAVQDAVTVLRFEKDKDILDDAIVTISGPDADP